MAKLNVFVLCDADGTVQNGGVLSVEGVCDDDGFFRVVGGLPSIVVGEAINEQIRPLMSISPTIAVTEHSSLAGIVARRMLDVRDRGFGVNLFANADSYRHILDIDGGIRLYAVAPAHRNGEFSYRGWVVERTTAIYGRDGAEYWMAEMVRGGTVDVDYDTMMAEISRLEDEFNSGDDDDDDDLTESDRAELDDLVKRVVGGWRISSLLLGHTVSDMGDDDDDGTIKLSDDDDGMYRVSLDMDTVADKSDVDDLQDAVNELGEHSAKMYKQISGIYGSLKMMSELMLRTVDSGGETAKLLNRTVDIVSCTRAQMARMMCRMHRVMHDIENVRYMEKGRVNFLEMECNNLYSELRKYRRLHVAGNVVAIVLGIMACAIGLR